MSPSVYDTGAHENSYIREWDGLAMYALYYGNFYLIYYNEFEWKKFEYKFLFIAQIQGTKTINSST